MINDIGIINAYGKLVSDYHEPGQIDAKLCTKEQLEFILAEIAELFNKTISVDIPPRIQALTKTPSDNVEILRSIESIRLRMIGVLLGAGIGATNSSGVPHLEIALKRALTTGRSGMTWGVLEKECVILFPYISSDADSALVSHDLLKVYEDQTVMNNWVIDCSAVRKLPVILAATLLGYRENLSIKNKRVSLVWLPHSALPANLIKRFESLFDIQKIGEFYFTRGMKE